MIKKILTEQLRPGMYIHDLNCGWLDHSFLSNRFAVKHSGVIAKIQQAGIRECYIDTDKGADVADAPTQQEVQQELDDELDAIVGNQSDDLHEVPLREERTRAERIQQQAITLINELMSDIRLGQQIDLERTAPILKEMTDSIFRNRDALLGLQRIRRQDRYTFEHSVNVAVLMISFGRSLGFERELLNQIGTGAFLHDIGKTLIEKAILNKPGPLTEAELKEMREHVVHSERMLEAAPGIPLAGLQVAAEHHERMDGSGYPKKKRGEAISQYGRMAAIVDIYDALTSDRVYHKGEEPSAALRKLLEWGHYHVDVELVQHFIRCVGIYPVGTLVRLASHRVGLVIESNSNSLLQPVVRVFMDAKRRRYLDVHDLNLSDPQAAGDERILKPEQLSDWPVDLERIAKQP
ncbi:HD-GYP domain-containing protein [Thiorhodovibrio frisius]|uniref:HD-GYP domain-containing protein n=1 Tax=Thiorhodovibrio frisius TaxID=631362 RepID=H8YXM6_9GAMM|nr:HD-GYP domain-containing protein [Thiorhodovibrio frisius]EIC23202.1 HD-GYP domain-containing protein [Thiorhodovibrio frisius]WPL23721.1 Cyclic di-GMP phosphodiesterase response regulator RpfG [Thiorhodovibrio frisius]